MESVRLDEEPLLKSGITLKGIRGSSPLLSAEKG